MPAQLRGDSLLGTSRQTVIERKQSHPWGCLPVADVGNCSTQLQENRTENSGNLI
jgi:hypothetical protein